MATVLDRLLDYLVSGPGFTSIRIIPLKDTLYGKEDGHGNRFQLDITNGPLSDYQVYTGMSIEDILKQYIKDLQRASEEELDSTIEELKILTDLAK